MTTAFWQKSIIDLFNLNMTIHIRYKILLGYFVLMAVIISMAAILFHERKRVCEIESEVTTIHQSGVISVPYTIKLPFLPLTVSLLSDGMKKIPANIGNGG